MTNKDPVDRAGPSASASEWPCKDVQPLLGDAFDGRLPRQDALAVRAHLLRCPACRSEYGQFDTLRRWIRELGAEQRHDPALDVEWHRELFRRIQSGEGAPMAILPQSSASRGFAFFASGMATAAALLLSLWLLLDGAEEQSPQQLVRAEPERPTPREQSPLRDDVAAPTVGTLQFVPDSLGMRPADAVSVAQRFVRTANETFQRTIFVGQRAKRSGDVAVLRNDVLEPAQQSHLSAGFALQLRGRQLDMTPETAAYLVQVHRHTGEIQRILRSGDFDLHEFERSLERAARVPRPERLVAQIVLPQEAQLPWSGAQPGETDRLLRIEIRRVLPTPQDQQTLRLFVEILRQHGLQMQIHPGEGHVEIYERTGR